ncbi:type I phosphomannose isomerase catalytic subunit [Clostridium sp. D33t1_170424_F3]|uniref:type I phosphomannose isomerase catalytic subunit n=1 Tax=Clostridium sp. D33t1_170424_F3 TaxID=2787099 RepID=UPI0025711095|nr:type I phosphomannose isomerase catalytic subunit [Clostridium sp. D33t1_170424_F3]
MNAYPMKLRPVYKDNLWGGERLKKDYNKQTDMTPLAESWELSCHRDGSSVIANGPCAGMTLSAYLEQNPEAAGTRGVDFPSFPILFKLIDAKDDLSVQVHPDDAYAMRVEGEYGKTEMWIVLECEPGAKLVYGFRQEMDRETFRRRIAEQTLMEAVNEVPVHKGDVFFIPAGTLHAIGKGIVIAEIQQNSNTTYRVYDYGRVDANGSLRELHIEKALDVTDLEAYRAEQKAYPMRKETGGTVTLLADCPYFKTRQITLDGCMDRTVDGGSFEGLFCAEGAAVLRTETEAWELQKGDTMFLPAGLGAYALEGCAVCISMGV